MKTKIIIAVVVVVAIFWWLRTPNEIESNLEKSLASQGEVKSSSLSSAIEPINIVNPIPASRSTVFSDDASEKTQQEFDLATDYILKGNWNDATRLLEGIIKDYPLAIEPYINLAVVYAETNKLEQARLILLDGLRANKNYGMLYSNLQSIHGALAGQAYRSALVSQESDEVIDYDDISDLDLPLIGSIDLQPVQRQRQLALQQQVDTLLASQSVAKQDTEGLLDLKQQLSIANDKTSELDSTYKVKLLALETELERQKTDKQKLEALLAIAAVPTETLASNDNEVARNVAQETNISEVEVPEVEPVTEQFNHQEQGQALVESWAASWANQQVDSYTGHYKADYVPPRSSLTHRQWLEQRRVRLTNKTFIEVSVSDFEVAETNNQFSVTFLQHYRSDNIDDKIVKRLVYAKNGEDWANAKIIDELVITN